VRGENVEREAPATAGQEADDGEHLLGGRRVVDAEAVLGIADEREQLGIVDREGRIGVGLLGTEADVEQPLRGRSDKRLADVRRADALAALECEQRGPRDGVERFDAAIGHDRQPAETDEIKFAGIRR